MADETPPLLPSLTAADVRELVAVRVRQTGSASRYAQVLGLSRRYVDDVQHGRRAPGPGVLRDLGLMRVDTVSYVRVGGGQ